MGAVMGDRSDNRENKPKPNINRAAKKIALSIKVIPPGLPGNLPAHQTG